jgi:hypothetical protein
MSKQLGKIKSSSSILEEITLTEFKLSNKKDQEFLQISQRNSWIHLSKTDSVELVLNIIKWLKDSAKDSEVSAAILSIEERITHQKYLGSFNDSNF